MDRLGVEDVGAAFPHRVAYHPTCHSLRVTRVGDAPLRLLRNVRGLELVRARRGPTSAAASAAHSRSRTPTPRARCSPTSATRIEASGAEVCTAVDGSCLIHIGGGLSRRALARAHRAPRRDPRVRDRASSFPAAARRELANAQLRANLRIATDTIRAKRAARRRRAARLGGAARGRPRDQGGRARAARRVPRSQFEEAVDAAGGHVHWARDAAEANAVVVEVARAHGAREVVKVKSLTTDEIGLNDALAAAGIHALETDFAELILQLDGDWPSHILVPAIHRNRTRDPRPLRAHDRARARLGRARATSPRRRVSTCASGSSTREGRRQRRELRRRRDRHGLRRRVGGQRAHVHDAAAGARHHARDREARADASPTSRCSSSSCRARRPASG